MSLYLLFLVIISQFQARTHARIFFCNHQPLPSFCFVFVFVFLFCGIEIRTVLSGDDATADIPDDHRVEGLRIKIHLFDIFCCCCPSCCLLHRESFCFYSSRFAFLHANKLHLLMDIKSLFNDLNIADACTLSLPLIFMLLVAVVACAFVLILKEKSELRPSNGGDKRRNATEEDDSQQTTSLLATNGDYNDDDEHDNGITTTSMDSSSVVTSSTTLI